MPRVIDPSFPQCRWPRLHRSPNAATRSMRPASIPHRRWPACSTPAGCAPARQRPRLPRRDSCSPSWPSRPPRRRRRLSARCGPRWSCCPRSGATTSFARQHPGLRAPSTRSAPAAEMRSSTCLPRTITTSISYPRLLRARLLVRLLGIRLPPRWSARSASRSNLRFVERSCLSPGKILHYRAHRDIHAQGRALTRCRSRST